MNKDRKGQNIYRELTPAGVGLCIATGAAAETVTLLLTGVRLGSVPVAVGIFLWGMFGILSAGVLFLADIVIERLQNILEWVRHQYGIFGKQSGHTVLVCDEKRDGFECTSESARIIYGDFGQSEFEISFPEHRKAS